MQRTQDDFTPRIRLKLLVLTIFSFITLVLAALFVIMLSLQSFTGFASSSPLVLGTCTHTYYSTKYSQTNKILIVIFITAVISIFLQIVISILVFTPLVTKLVPSPTRIGMSYILISLHMLSIIIGFSKFVSFHLDFNLMGSTCTISYSQILITILLTISSVNMVTSLSQYVCLLVLVQEINLQQKKQQAQTYKKIINITNNTVQNCQELTKNAHATKKTQKYQPYKAVEAQSKVQNVKRQDQRFDSYNQMAVKNPQIQVQRESPIQPAYTHANSIFEEEESFKSIMRNQKLALGKIANKLGPIAAASNMQQSEKVYRSRGYLSYIRKMNSNQINQSIDKEAQLIAVIRGKYAK